MTEIRLAVEEKMREGELAGWSNSKPPQRVKWVPRLVHDIEALKSFVGVAQPPKRLVRPAKGAPVAYLFGDASGSGFGSSCLQDEKIKFKYGQWKEEYGSESSNYRELANLVLTVEEAHSKGTLKNSELFVFTDNSTADSAFFKGMSSSEKLLNLILRLHNLQMHGEVMIHFVHIAGTRMIEQGTDGLSRGNTSEGVMQGQNFLSFIPLNLNVLERQAQPLKGWVDSWFGSFEPCKWLSPEDWYHEGHFANRCVWTPAPAAGGAALEQLAKVVHKRPQHAHVVIIPCLMTALWRRTLSKICDLIFTVPIGSDLWSLSQHEP